MAGTNLGSAYVTIMPSAKGISGSISKVLSGESRSAGLSSGKKIVGAIKGVIAGASIGKFFKDALDAGGELEQNLGGTKAVFGKFASNVQKTAEDAYKNMGLSASDYMATANKMGSLFQGSGVKQERAMELTTNAMQRAADVASVMGLDTTAAMESIAGAAKGNFTMMDNLGVAMNATTLSAYALEKGINFEWNTASNAEKAELAMKMFMDRTSQYAGNFAKESDETFSGSLSAMKAAATNFISNLSLGRDISGPLTELLETSKTFLFGNMLPMVGNILKEIPTVVGGWLKNAFNNLPGLVDSAVNIIRGLADGMKNNSGEFLSGVSELAKAAFTALKETDWGGLVGSIFDLVSTALVTFVPKLWEGFNNLLRSIFDWIKGVNWSEVLSDLVTKAGEFIKTFWNALKTNASVLWDGIKTIASKAAEVFTSIDWADVGMKIVTFIGNAIGSVGRWIWDGLTSIADTAREKFKDVDWAEAGQTAFHTLVDAISAIGSYLWEVITTLATTAGEHFKGIDWGQVGQDVVTAIANGIAAIGGFLYEGLSTLATSASEFFTSIDWENAGRDAVTFIVNGVVNVATTLWDKMKAIGGMASEKMKDIDWKQLGIDILTAIKDGVLSIGSFLWGAVQQIGEMAWDKIKEIDWVQSGIDIINGIIDGIKQFGSNIADTLVGFAQDAWTELKDFFSIGSPSKLMRDTVGKWIPLGIAEGIENEGDAVTEAMDKIAADVATGFNPVIDTSFAGPSESTQSIVVNNYISGSDDPEEFASRLARQLKMELRMA